MTAKAIRITRGELAVRIAHVPINGVIASQPTNESISTVAAWPIEPNPCGANGVQFAGCAWPAEPTTATTTSATSTPTRPSWAPDEVRAPDRVTASTASSSPAANSVAIPRPPPTTDAM